MSVARERALTLVCPIEINYIMVVEMSVARERALTQDVPSLLDVPLPVEMSVARERAFPRQNSQSKLNIRDI